MVSGSELDHLQEIVRDSIEEKDKRRLINTELNIIDSSIRLCNARMFGDSSFALGINASYMTKDEQLRYLDLRSRFNNRCRCRELKIPGLTSLVE